ncbi:hypothetical protein PINS_up007234 [Pythium insidiosum]|nr:hypothetical protein PINS_up007234 [Pythium insidiosum]
MDDGHGSSRVSTVAAFFAQHYAPLRSPQLPCVHVGAANRHVCLPLEVCVVASKQRRAGRLTESQTTQMLRVAQEDPATRKSKIEETLADVQLTQDPVLPAFGLRVEPQMLRATARVLDAPPVTLGGGRSVAPQNGVWQLDARRYQFYRCAALGAWSVVDLTSGDGAGGGGRGGARGGARGGRGRGGGGGGGVSTGAIEAFAKALGGVLSQLGVRCPRESPRIVSLSSDRGGSQGARGRGRGRGAGAGGGSRLDAVRRALQAAMAPQGGRRVDVVLCVLPGRDAALYADIKRLGDVELGVITQCCQARHVGSPRPAYLTNLALKVHAKLGGANWAVPLELDDDTLVCGADVTHPSPGASDTAAAATPSIAALVGALDGRATQYTAVYAGQTPRVEEVEALEAMMTALLRRVVAARGDRKPLRRVLYFRDGVAESQFDMVREREVRALQRAATAVVGAALAVSAIVVQKRHHTRLFPARGRGNVPAGTVLDSVVCHPREHDFFLASHAGPLGTTRPCHYHVVYDANRLGADELQRLAFALCFGFARATRSVSLVPAVYYAHLVAYRARCYGVANGRVPALHAELTRRPERAFYM